jgi:hypothetical protein
MWLQATLTLDDLTHALHELLPLEIHLDEPDASASGHAGPERERDEAASGRADRSGGRVIGLSAPRRVELIPSLGLRVETSAHIVWPVLGLDVPATVRSVQALFRPRIEEAANGEASLGFALSVEALDLSLVPGIVESAVKDVLNEELARPGVLPAWRFMRTMDFAFDVPRQLGFDGKLLLAASWADLKITEDGVTLAMSFRAGVDRAGARRHEAATPSAVASDPVGVAALPPLA